MTLSSTFSRGCRRAAVVVAVLLAVGVLLLPSGALATGEPIEVVSDQPMVRFPSGVDFDLVLEGDADIEEVRLYYRVAGSGVWNYTYPSFDPSNHVEASLSLNTSGTAYLPPGTEVEYFYSIRDTEGNAVRTPLASFIYLDDRFDWQTTQIGPLTLYWHDQRESRVRQVADQAEQSIARASSLLDVTLEQPIKGIIYNSHSEARLAFPARSATLSEEQVFQGFAFRSQGVFLGVGLQPSLIVHETAHFLIGEAVSSPGAFLPSWLNEGFASYVEPGQPRPLRRTEGGLPLRSMSAVPGRPGDIRSFYAKAQSVVGYLVESYGEARFRQLIASLDRGERVNEALQSTYGFGVDGLDDRWYEAIGSTAPAPRQNGSRSPWVFLESTFLGFLVLAVMALVVGKLLFRRLVRRPEAPEELDEPEDPFQED